MKNLYLLIFNLFAFVVFSQTVTTFAGSSQGYADASGIASKFDSPSGVCPDNNGNLYVADRYNHKIRKIVIATGVVSTFAGSTSGYADGTGILAKFSEPFAICFDNMGNLYVADYQNHKIRKIVISTGAVSTVAGSTPGYLDGIGSSAKFNYPTGLCCDLNGANIYVVDNGNYRIRKIEIATNTVSTVAGSTQGLSNGVGSNANFYDPFGICTDFTNLYVADGQNNDIRKINLSTGVVTTFATGFSGLAYGICIDYNGFLYVSDVSIKKIDLTTASVSILAGSATGFSDGVGASAQFYYPIGLCVAGTNLYVADSRNNKIRKVTLPTLNIQENEITQAILIYPNPNNGKFSIKSNNEIVNQVNIYSLDGKLIFSQNINTVNPEFSLESVSKGTYLATVTLENGSERRSKIVIE